MQMIESILLIFQTISQVLSAPKKQNIKIKAGISSLQIFHLMLYVNNGHKKLLAAVKNFLLKRIYPLVYERTIGKKSNKL